MNYYIIVPFFKIILISDYNDYMTSLHLPSSVFNDVQLYELPYLFISGNDTPGDYPKDNVQYVPIHIVRGNYLLPPSSIMESKDINELYYIYNNSTYMQFIDGQWQNADPAFLNEVFNLSNFLLFFLIL